MLAFGFMPLAVYAAEVYLAPGGDDTQSGLSREAAVATLQKAYDLAAKLSLETDRVRLVISPGTYHKQSIFVDQNRYVGNITIGSVEGAHSESVRFIGSGETATWLKLRGSAGRHTGLIIRGLVIENYGTAIALDGSRDDVRRGNLGTVIENNIFRYIGSVRGDPAFVTMSAIRLKNSSENRIIGNKFISIRNNIACGAMHAVYLAHFSSKNEIRDNDFVDLCGSAIKLRDRSNGNVIVDNRFTKLEKEPAIEEWFCDMAVLRNCTKVTGECPSTGNLARRNALKDSDGAKLLIVRGGLSQRTWCDQLDFSRERVAVE